MSPTSCEHPVHDARVCFADALRVAVQWQARNPAFASTLRQGGPGAARLRASFTRHPAAFCHFRHTGIRPGAEQPDPLIALAETAEDWLTFGQFSAMAALYDRWTDDGTLASLPRTDRAVLHGLLVLAMRSGPQVVAATRYVRKLLEAQFGVIVSHETVRASYRRLANRHLLEVLPGRSGQSRRSSTCIEFRSVLTGTSGWPSDRALSALTMCPSAILALSAYRVQAYAARAAVFHGAPGPPWPTSAPKGLRLGAVG